MPEDYSVTNNPQENAKGYSAARYIYTPYENITIKDYHIEKRRLQLELLKIQTKIIDQGLRVCVLIDGRDAAGKGSLINRFTENLIPQKTRIVQLGIPSEKDSKNWFNRYKKHLPKKSEMVFFDRSWYNRALIEPTMGYCTKSQYKYFMNNVSTWEHKLIDNGLILVKFYLSVDIQTQLVRFHQRLTDPLTYWKISPNDFKARKKWQTFTKYKEQMLQRTSSPKSPWVVVRSNSKMETRLTCMLHLVRLIGNTHFKPLTREQIPKDFNAEINGIPFQNLTIAQYETLKDLVQKSSKDHNIEAIF
jgi:polyphosphate kinase 2